MSPTQVDELLDKLVRDARFRSEFEADRTRVLRGFSLSGDQREAMMSLDVGGLVSAARTATRPCPPGLIV